MNMVIQKVVFEFDGEFVGEDVKWFFDFIIDVGQDGCVWSLVVIGYFGQGKEMSCDWIEINLSC